MSIGCPNRRSLEFVVFCFCFVFVCFVFVLFLFCLFCEGKSNFWKKILLLLESKEMEDQGGDGKENEKEMKADPRANFSRSRADTPRDLGLILSKMKIQEGHGPQALHPLDALVC